jgi:type IV secretion system VirB5/TraC/TraE/TrbJ family protein
MIDRLKVFSTLTVLCISSPIYADDPISDIFSLLANDMYPLEQTIDGDIKDITNSMKQYMTGSYNMGNINFDKDLQSWGNDTNDWSSILSVAQSGGSSSDYGQVVQQLAKQYPIDTTTINQVNENKDDQSFYQLKAQTALAARAASQLDYNNIQKQITNQQNLQQQIDSTPNEKAAIDLQNRLQVEGNLINLELLRQISLLSQQKSLDAQEEVNSAVKNAQFLQTSP